MTKCKIKVQLSDENLRSMVPNATSLFFNAGLPVDEDTVKVTCSEGENCVTVHARPRKVNSSVDLKAFVNVLDLFGPMDHSYIDKASSIITLMCVPIDRLGVELSTS